MRSLTNLTDQQLIHLFVEGESDALETLILRHKDKIYTSIFLLVKDKDHFRKVKRTPTVRNSEDRDIFEILNITEDGVDRKMMQRQSHDKVRQMLDLLPPDQREVIILRHYAEMSFKEIASMTNCSINTALGRMRYGLINLRKMMAEKQIAL